MTASLAPLALGKDQPAIAAAFHAGAPITGLAVSGDHARIAAATGEGKLIWLPLTGDAMPESMAAHDGAVLAIAADPAGGVLTAGDDGRLLRHTPTAPPHSLFTQKGRWLEQLATHETGIIAVSAGKQVHVISTDGTPMLEPLAHDSTAAGLAINAKGKRLAVAHYGGISLWWLRARETKPARLAWAGSHLGAIWHPVEDIVLTTMQEPALHGWRLSDMNEMRMQGYLQKVKSWGWTAKGKWLVTAGAEQPICWPFFGGGPWGKPPAQPGSPRDAVVTAVAPHPKDEMVAAGHADGLIQLCAFGNMPGFMIRPPADAEITALSWSPAGDRLFAGDAAGHLLVFTAESIRAGMPLVP